LKIAEITDLFGADNSSRVVSEAKSAEPPDLLLPS
jgi:hypothetical protein